jgi:hypothetical protein
VSPLPWVRWHGAISQRQGKHRREAWHDWARWRLSVASDRAGTTHAKTVDSGVDYDYGITKRVEERSQSWCGFTRLDAHS